MIIVFTIVCDCERKIRQNVAFVALLPHVADCTEWNVCQTNKLLLLAGRGRDHHSQSPNHLSSWILMSPELDCIKKFGARNSNFLVFSLTRLLRQSAALNSCSLVTLVGGADKIFFAGWRPGTGCSSTIRRYLLCKELESGVSSTSAVSWVKAWS